MTERDAGDFFYSLKDIPVDRQETAVKAKLGEDPTLRSTMAFDLWRVYTNSKVGELSP